jgi:coenzyme PQQ synthesis protein D (PqqD)
MSITFTNRVRVSPDVLVSSMDGESVLLNLQSETYFGLDEVGTRMWNALTGAESLQAAFDVLAAEYEVEPDQLRHDLEQLVNKLAEQGLLEIER